MKFDVLFLQHRATLHSSVMPYGVKGMGMVINFLREHGEGLPSIEGDLDAHRPMLESPANQVMLAVPEGAASADNILGHVSLHVRHEWCGRTGYASMLAVRRDVRGQGIGKGLMKRIAEEARILRLTSVECICTPAHESARAVLMQAGWKLEEGSDRHFRLDL